MARYIETKVRYCKMQEDGQARNVTESYLVDALSFTEAEARITEEMRPYISGDYSVEAVKKSRISEIFFNEGGDRYYMVKANFITYDDKTCAEKKTASFILVQAADFKGALERFEKGMEGSMADWEISGIAETGIMGVYDHRGKEVRK